MGRARSVDRDQRTRLGGALQLRAVLCRDAARTVVGPRADGPGLLAELAGLSGLLPRRGLAVRPLGRPRSRGDRRVIARRCPGTDRPSAIAPRVLLVVRR